MLFVELGYWLFVFSKLFFFKVEKKNDAFRQEHKEQYEEKITNTPTISVVICGRNEAANFEKNLPLILTQRYPNFEVIVVNDASEDDSASVLNRFVENYPHLLRVIHIVEKKMLGKKAALTEGINAAKSEFLLLTDADCSPPSIHWVSGMVAALSRQNTEIVLGYAPCRHVQSGFLNSFITFETLWTAVQYLGFAQAGMPYMGVGRNLLYRKSLFQQANGFAKHANLASGDDDLFVNSVSNCHNTTICLNVDTFMWSDPKKTWKDYRRQKQRHLSAGTRYKFWHQCVLGSFALAQFFSWFLALMLILFNFSMIFVATILIVRLFLLIMLYGLIVRKLHIDENKFDFFLKLPLLDLFFIFFYSTFAAISIIYSLFHQFIHKTQKNIYWK